MKVIQPNETTKKAYQAPILEKVSIDNEVSLVMGSTPPSPGDAPTNPANAWG